MGVEVAGLSRPELEQLYLKNVQLLQQQQHYMRMLERELTALSNEYQRRSLASINWSVYKQYLRFLTEPSHLPDEDLPLLGCCPSANAKEVAGRGDEEEGEEFVFSEDRDFYAKFLKYLP